MPRHSIATTRRIIDTRMSSSGRYRPENMVAYMSGNAANMAPAAVISQTSLPSHTGPIVFRTARLRFSAASGAEPGPMRPMTPISMPTPKSKPSSTKKPRNSAASSRNQMSGSPITAS